MHFAFTVEASISASPMATAEDRGEEREREVKMRLLQRQRCLKKENNNAKEKRHKSDSLKD